jgi:prepilin peptidase CpaA
VQSLFPDTVYALTALACAGAGAICDGRGRGTPHGLTGAAIVLALVLHLDLGGWRSALSAVLAGLIAGGIFLLLNVAGGVGAGDVKLMTVVCCFAGLDGAPQVLVGTAMTGVLAALLVALYPRRAKDTSASVGRPPAHPDAAGLQPRPKLNLNPPPTPRLSYGLAIAAGAACSVYNACLR